MPGQRQVRCEGLHGSGCVLAMVGATTLLTSYVNDTNMISVSVPGKPCDALLVLSETGAGELVEQIQGRLVELRTSAPRAAGDLGER